MANNAGIPMETLMGVEYKEGKFRRKEEGFYSGSTTYTCSQCGKKTRDTGHDEKSVEQCLRCYKQNIVDNAIENGQYDELEDFWKK